jgi:hypothetical protein
MDDSAEVTRGPCDARSARVQHAQQEPAAIAPASVEDLLDLARMHRGWSRRQLARALGRESRRLAPRSGRPKLDVLVHLARALEWRIEDVTSHLCRAEDLDMDAPARTGPDFAELTRHSQESLEANCTAAAVAFARHAWRGAATADERSIAALHEARAWRADAHHRDAIEATRRGLVERRAAPDARDAVHVALLTGLMDDHGALWHLEEAAAIADALLAAGGDAADVAQRRRATALAARGDARRRFAGGLTAQPPGACTAAADPTVSRGAADDLARAADLFAALPGGEAVASAASARICASGAIEAQAAAGALAPQEAIALLAAAIQPPPSSPRDPEPDAALLARGWSAVFACNVALRHETEEQHLHALLAAFLPRAADAARRTRSWPLHERVLTLEDERRARLARWTGVRERWSLDQESIRAVVGTMGRFPFFRPRGWRILRAAGLAGR